MTRSGPVEGERTRSRLFTVWACLMGALVGWTAGGEHYIVTLVVMVVFVLGGLAMRRIGAPRNKHHS